MIDELVLSWQIIASYLHISPIQVSNRDDQNSWMYFLLSNLAKKYDIVWVKGDLVGQWVQTEFAL